jgi:hypothetical protein
VALLELIQELPPASRFAEAQLNDPEVAIIIAKAERDQELKGASPKKWRPKYSEWDLHAQLLREIREAVYSRGDQVVAALGKRPKIVPVLPGPETEVDRAKQRLNEQAQLEIIYLFAPHTIPKE